MRKKITYSCYAAENLLLTCAVFYSVSISANTIELVDLSNVQDILVLHDGAHANSYLLRENGGLYFRTPFPGSEVPFELEVFDQSTGEKLFDTRYVISTSGVRYLKSDENAELTHSKSDDAKADSSMVVEHDYGAQLDLTGVLSNARGSDSPEAVAERDGESDVLAGYSVSWVAPNIVGAAELEAVHRSNPDSAVRFDGPRADISRMSSQFTYTGRQGAQVSVNLGDVSVESPNTLVNTGIASRGFVVGFSSPDSRFTWSAGRFYGHDIVGAIHGPLGVSNGSYRIASNYNYRLIEREDVSWNISFTNLRAKRTTEDDLSVGAINSGEWNDVWGVSSQIGLLDERINLSFSAARSKYSNPDSLNGENIPLDEGFELFNPGVTSGNAYRHMISWEAYRDVEYNRSLGFEYATERADPFYRSVHGYSTADRRQWSLFSTFSAGVFNGRVGTTQYQNNLDNLISIHTLDEAVHQAEIGINLSQFKESDGRPSENRQLLPSSIGVTATVEELRTLNGDEIILAPVIEGFDFMDRSTQSYGITANWENEYHNTSVDLGYSYLDIDQRERQEADRRDISYGIAHSINGDRWHLNAYFTISKSDDLDTASLSSSESTQVGVSGSYQSESGVNWSLSVENETTNLHYQSSGETDESDASNMSLSVDIGAWLAGKMSLAIDPTMSFRWHHSESDQRSSFYSSDQISNSISFNMGVAF